MGRKLVAIAATLCASGCMDLSFGPSSGPSEPEVLWVMVGAEIELHLSDCSSDEDEGLVHCVSARIDELKSVEVEEAFEILASKSADGEALISLRAKQEGHASLKYSYRDGNGLERRGHVLLEAAVPQRVSASVYCESGRSEFADAIVLGAGTELDVFVEANAANGRNLETGTLALFDFGVFEQLEGTGSHVKLRAPLGTGSYPWRNVLQEQVDVQVVDQFGVAFRAWQMDGQLTQLLLDLADDPSGKTLCTTPADAVVYVKVESGDCQLATNGARLAGVVPLALPTYNGSRLQVLGTGECVVSAQTSGVEPVTLTLSPRAVDEVLPEGETISTSPVPLMLLPALPEIKCFEGRLDGKCETPDTPAFDDDCSAGTGVQMVMSDTRGPVVAEPVGAGLVTSVSVGAFVGLERSKLSRSPMGIGSTVTSPVTASVEVGECAADAPTIRIAHVTLEGAGTGQLEFRASNLEMPGHVGFELREVAACGIETSFEYDKFSDLAAPVFAGSSLSFSAQCQDAAGNALRGEPPLELTSDQAESRARLGADGKLFVGDGPGHLQLKSMIGVGGQELEVVEADAASTLSATMRTIPTPSGDAMLVKVSAFDQAGRMIQGAGHVPVTAELVAEPGSWLFDLNGTYGHAIAVRPVGNQPATLTLTLGEARTQLDLPPPSP
ncbi:MAG: hypothetical protein QM778_27870 [Myxococcales bacterium]